MTDHDPGAASREHSAAEAHIHMPQNSFVPVCLALSLTLTFTGLLIPLKLTFGAVIIPVLAVVGLLLVLACWGWWIWGGRREYHVLPG